MPTYLVEIRETYTFEGQVEADSAQEASDIAIQDYAEYCDRMGFKEPPQDNFECVESDADVMSVTETKGDDL